MKVFVFMLMILGSTVATRLISTGEIEYLFKKFVQDDLSTLDASLFYEVLEIIKRPEFVTAASFSNSTEIRTTIDCIICRSALAAAFDSVHAGETEEQLTEIVVTLCTIIGIESYPVCRGAVALNIPIIHYIIRTVPEATPATFCGLLLQTATNPNICPYADHRFEWQVELPPKTETISVTRTDDQPFTVALLTDFHIDPLYEAYGVADCDEPTCCRVGQRPKQSYINDFFKSADEEKIAARSLVNDGGELKIDLDEATNLMNLRRARANRIPTTRQSTPAGYWGDFRNCDTPIWAFDDAVDRIVETHRNVDAVYYIGDSIDHFVWETTYDLINSVNRYVMQKLQRSFGEDIPIIPVIGNHESQPTNQFAPSSVGGNINTTWLYEALANKWADYIPEDQKQTFGERGEFSTLIKPGLRVITLNNNVAYRYNWWLLYDPLDAKKHLDWLVEELYKAELAGESVHILAHIPPGVHDLTYTWTREYNRIVNRFSSTIKAEFNGHTHSDEFKIFYDEEGTPINVAWGAGSVTTYSFYNLNYKIVTFDGAAYEPIYMVNYVYNLTEANLTPNRRPHWFQLYDMKNTFQLSDLSAASINDLVHRMVTSDKMLLDMYAAFFSKLSESRWSWCNNDCKLDMVCKIVVTVLWDRERCNELVNLFYNSRDSY